MTGADDDVWRVLSIRTSMRELCSALEPTCLSTPRSTSGASASPSTTWPPAGCRSSRTEDDRTKRKCQSHFTLSSIWSLSLGHRHVWKTLHDYSAYVLAVCIYYILCLCLPVGEINKSGGAKKTGPLAAAIVKRVADISYSGVTIRLRHAGSFLMMTLLRIYCCITAPFWPTASSSPVFWRHPVLQYNTVLALITRLQSTARPNLRRGQSLGGGVVGGAKESTSVA